MKDGESKFVFAGWLVDGSGGPIQKNMLLEIKNGYVHDVKPAPRQTACKQGVLDLSFCTILPGLVDSHVHLFISGTGDRKIRDFQLNAGFDDIKDVISGHIDMHFKYGVAAVRDGGDRNAHALRYKTEILNDKRSPVFLKVAGRAWHKQGRYGRLIGRSPNGMETLAKAIAKENERIDHVKIVNSGVNSLTIFGKMTPAQFDLRELQEAVAAAGMRGCKIMAHANGEVPVKIAIESGCHSIEHGFFMGKENLKRMAAKKIIWVPTACTMKAYAEMIVGQESKSDYKEVALRNLEHQLKQISMARELGVPVALGTDAGSPGVHHGEAVIEELALLIKAGFALPEAIRCATLNGAKLLELNDFGLLARGMSATFIAVKGDPSNLPDSLGRIERVFISGQNQLNL